MFDNFKFKKIQWVSYNCQTRIIWCVDVSQPLNFNNGQFEETKSRDASMRSRSNSPIRWTTQSQRLHQTKMRRSYIRA